MCSCGMSNVTKESVAAIVSSGSVNVAVMTQYLAGDLGSFGGSGGLSAGSFTEQSSSIFITFGCLWGFGSMLMIFHYSQSMGWAAPYVKQKRKEIGAKLATETRHRQLLSVLPHQDACPTVSVPDRSEMQGTIRRYVESVLPVSYLEGEWWRRLWWVVCEHHIYCRAASSVYAGIFVDPKFSQHSISQSVINSRKRAMIDIAQVMTVVMISVLVLAVLYDFQYPKDDGTCNSYLEEYSCLARKSLLDTRQ